MGAVKSNATANSLAPASQKRKPKSVGGPLRALSPTSTRGRGVRTGKGNVEDKYCGDYCRGHTYQGNTSGHTYHLALRRHQFINAVRAHGVSLGWMNRRDGPEGRRARPLGSSTAGPKPRGGSAQSLLLAPAEQPTEQARDAGQDPSALAKRRGLTGQTGR